MGKIHKRFKLIQTSKHFAKIIMNGEGKQLMKDIGLEKTKSAMKHLGLTEKEVLRSVKIKGHYDGLCNVTHCQSPNQVYYYNRIMHAFYCPHCTADINRSNAYHKDVDDGKPFINFKTKEEAAKLYVK